MRLHPLHTPAMIAEHVLSTGEHFPVERRTGRSTVQALHYLAVAIDKPHQRITVLDHHGTTAATKDLIRRMQEIAGKLGLGHLVFDMDSHTVTFTN